MTTHKKRPILFMGTPGIAAYQLKSLYESDDFDVVGVVTQPDRASGRKMQLRPSEVKKIASEFNIPVLTPVKITDKDLQTMKSWKAEAVVVVAFGQILSQKFLDQYPEKVVNVHASLLPKWRGAAPIQRSIMAGDQETGVCLQVMVKELDAGDLIGQRTIELHSEMNSLDLHELMKPLAADLLLKEFAEYLNKKIMPISQNKELATYAHKLNKIESEIDWTKSAQEIDRHIRGMVLGPGTYCFMNGKKVKIHRACVDSSLHGAPGEVLLSNQQEGIVVGCGEESLKILELQMESKKRQSSHDFLIGHTISLGTILIVEA